MKGLFILLLIMGIAFMFYSVVEGIRYYRVRNCIRTINGVIYNLTTASAESMRLYNSKWAKVSFTVDGGIIVSENRIQVPMSSKVGDKITVKYDVNNPKRIITVSVQRMILFLSIAVAFLLIAFIIWLKAL